MKNINEIEGTLSALNNQYQEIKRRYNRHAAFSISLKTNHSFFVDDEIIQSTFICCNNGTNNLSISTFPFYHTSDFARFLHVRCNNCGTSWVPSFDFDLDKYYENQYAEDIQPWRKFDGSLLIEAPCGADQVERASQTGGRGSVIFEPHTISFSTYGLYKILLKSGFSIKKISLDKSSKDLSLNLADGECEILPGDVSGGGLVCICQSGH